MHPRLHRPDVLNAAIEYAEELFAPVADYVDVIGSGNHDTAVTKYHSLDPVSILIDRLNQRHKTQIAYGGYSGYYRLNARYGNQNFDFKLRYFHGSGGSAPISKGLIDQARMLQWVSDADVLHLGHKHNRLVDNGILRERLNRNNRVVYEPVMVVHTASYFEPSPERPGWAQEKGFAPQAKGGVMLTLRFSASSNRNVQPVVKVTAEL